MPAFIDVIVPVKVPLSYTYAVPLLQQDSVLVGSRVLVLFGKKVLTGIVRAVHDTKPLHYEAKEIIELLDEKPVLNGIQLNFLDWIAAYYLCYPGEVLQAMLPAGLKLQGSSAIRLAEWPEDEALLKDQEVSVLKWLKDGPLNVDEIAKRLQRKNCYPLINKLIEKGYAEAFDQLDRGYKPKTANRLRLSSKFASDKAALEQVLTSLEKKEKQFLVLMHYLREMPDWHKPEGNKGLDPKSWANAGLSESSLKTLEKAGVFESFKVNVSRLVKIENTSATMPVLSTAQEAAHDQIEKAFSESMPVLLHGVTGSGKTEIYIHHIQKCLSQGKQVLFMLPEIALTGQLMDRLAVYFGKQMGVFHSRFSDNERIEVWKGLQENRLQIIVGVRSALFLPFSKLGLVIVDEEHDASYKQQDLAPRYQARDMALVLAKMHEAAILLGSASPSIESFYQAKSGKFELVSLHERFGQTPLPKIHVVDLKAERKQKTLEQGISAPVWEYIGHEIAEGRQLVIMQNRRGYSPMLMCDDCGHIPGCPNCSVSLHYHQKIQKLKCHHCGHQENMPPCCIACGSTALKSIGDGTEKVEEGLQLKAPQWRVLRMDQDTTRKKAGSKPIIQAFEKGEADILLGTQMVSKGFDFGKVKGGIVYLADSILFMPDFRAAERSFQLLLQFSGRPGRRLEQGDVWIQTYKPEHPVFRHLIGQDYNSFYQDEIQERALFHYPPFVRLIKITLRQADQRICYDAAHYLYKQLLPHLGQKRLGEVYAPYPEKLRNQFQFEILIKLERSGIDYNKIKKIIIHEIKSLEQHPDFRKTERLVDVDPY